MIGAEFTARIAVLHDLYHFTTNGASSRFKTNAITNENIYAYPTFAKAAMVSCVRLAKEHNLKIVAEGVNALRSAGRGMLVITHYQRLLDHIRPDVVHIMAAGRIIKTGGPELALELEASGYASRPRDFDDLLRILDGEIRLITPTDPDFTTSRA